MFPIGLPLTIGPFASTLLTEGGEGLESSVESTTSISVTATMKIRLGALIYKGVSGGLDEEFVIGGLLSSQAGTSRTALAFCWRRAAAWHASKADAAPTPGSIGP